MADFYSDRMNGPSPRTLDRLSEETTAGLIALVQSAISADCFAERFPITCDDGNEVAGTDVETLLEHMRGLIPDLRVPLRRNVSKNVPDAVVFDLLEYSASRISSIKERRPHEFFRHQHLTFQRGHAGSEAFRREVNTLLARGASTFHMTEDYVIERLGTREARAAVNQLPASGTGDDYLESLLAETQRLYFSRKPLEQRTALEKLWDAFERLKTIDGQRGTKQGISAILATIEPPEFREVIDSDMTQLTRVGDNFRIRHHKSDQVPLPTEASDYVLQRMSATVMFILKQLGRIDNKTPSG